jgi:sterol desaturase/sphingolipid hydroxylase (fatty acid hydroxylase superfamily)
MHAAEFVMILIVALVFIPLERIAPLRAKQKILRKNWRNDLVFLLVNGWPIKLGLFILVSSLMGVIRLLVPNSVTMFAQSQPVWLQVIEVIMIADLGFYFTHRMFHAVPFLWQFHAIHHSIEEMDWLAGHRVHPVDQIITKTVSLLPVFALGFSATAVVIFAFIYQWQSVLIHSNTRIDFGPFNWMFASPRFHHWHHANEREALDKNFAAQLPLIDAFFGTLFLPQTRAPSALSCRSNLGDRHHHLELIGRHYSPRIGGSRFSIQEDV